MSPLERALSQSLLRLPAGEPAAVALSGGIDSWVLALLLRQLGYAVRGVSLASGVAGYCEWDRVAALADQFEVPVEPIPAEDFESALPRFLAVTATPIYNLHPVSKLLLAEGAARRGIARLVGGDGADQVFRCERECDLLPLTEACFRHAGVELVAPFLAPEVRTLCAVPDPDKQPVRALAAALGIPPIPKRPTLYPGPSTLARTAQMLEELRCAGSPG
jgi:asparagine synthase (glutamine-hydrolysing)